MEFLFDSANFEEIQKYMEIFPITGVTSNPTIVKAEGKIDFFPHFKRIRNLIGLERTLHIQVLARNCEGMLAEADQIHSRVDEKVYIKIPVTEEGLKAIRILKERNFGVTATAIYTRAQGLLAIAAGADFIAPYFNRMENMDVNPRETIAMFAEMIERTGAKTKILAASFKNFAQVNDAFMAGAQAATVQPSLLHAAIAQPSIQKAVDDFAADWESIFGDVALYDL